jgi:thymidine kinase
VVHKELAATMGEGISDINLAAQPPAIILMAGLQGAGKTTTLLQSAHNYTERGMRTRIFTPRLDDRYGAGVVASRIGSGYRGDFRAPG